VRPGRAIAAALAAALAAGCGYGFSQRYVAVGDVDAIHVRPFENRSGEPELGAVVTAALRTELARRGSDAGAGSASWIEGSVRSTEPALTSTAATTWRIGIEVRARLMSAAGVRAERTIRREVVYLSGDCAGGRTPTDTSPLAATLPACTVDPLETEGRRALALRRAADEAAQELLRALERR
jgi:hypothetical protein